MADLQTALRAAAGPAPSHGPDLEEVRRRALRRRAARVGAGVLGGLAILAVVVIAPPDLRGIAPGVAEHPTEAVDVAPFAVVEPTETRFDGAGIPRPQILLDRQDRGDAVAYLLAHPGDHGGVCIAAPTEVTASTDGAPPRRMMASGRGLCFPGVSEVEFGSVGYSRLVGVTSPGVDRVVVEVEGGPWLSTPTQPLPGLSVRAFVLPVAEGTRIEGVTATRADVGRGDAILLSQPQADLWVSAPAFRAGRSCVQIRHSGAADQLCSSEDAVELRLLDDQTTLLVAGPPEADGWSVRYSNEESDNWMTGGRLVNRWLAMPTGITETGLQPGAQVERLEADDRRTGEKLFVAVCDRPLPEGACPVERVGPRPTLVRLWQDGTSPLGTLALLLALAAWIAGLIDAGRRRRWRWVAGLLLLNVVALAPYIVIRLHEARRGVQVSTLSEAVPRTVQAWGLTLLIMYGIGIITVAVTDAQVVTLWGPVLAPLLWIGVAGGYRAAWIVALVLLAFDGAGTVAGLVVPEYRTVVATTPNGWWMVVSGGLFELIQAALLLAPQTHKHVRRKLSGSSPPYGDMRRPYGNDPGVRQRLGQP